MEAGWVKGAVGGGVRRGALGIRSTEPSWTYDLPPYPPRYEKRERWYVHAFVGDQGSARA